jgi:hypothetical protein
MFTINYLQLLVSGRPDIGNVDIQTRKFKKISRSLRHPWRKGQFPILFLALGDRKLLSHKLVSERLVGVSIHRKDGVRRKCHASQIQGLGIYKIMRFFYNVPFLEFPIEKDIVRLSLL